MNTNLTPNEFKAAMILVKSCLEGMGGSRPSDLANDEFTWINITDLMDAGYTRHEAAGTLGALEEKGFVSLDEEDSVLTTEAWQWLDTKWDEK